MIVDEFFVIVGIVNMDMWSFFCNFELIVVLFEFFFMNWFIEDFEWDL